MCFVVCEIQLFQQANKNTTSTSTWYILEQVVRQVNLNKLELVSLSLQESESIPQSSLNLDCGQRQNLNCRRATGANTGLSKPWTPCYLSSQDASVVTALSGPAFSYIIVLLKKLLSPNASKKKKKNFIVCQGGDRKKDFPFSTAYFFPLSVYHFTSQNKKSISEQMNFKLLGTFSLHVTFAKFHRTS